VINGVLRKPAKARSVRRGDVPRPEAGQQDQRGEVSARACQGARTEEEAAAASIDPIANESLLSTGRYERRGFTPISRLCKLCARSTTIEDERQPPLPAGRRRLRRETARAEADSYTPHSGRRRTRRGNGRCRGGIERIGMEEGGVRLAAAAEERQ